MTFQDDMSKAQMEFDKAISHLKESFSHLQVGRASSALVENVPVDVYGVTQPLKAIASISIPDPRTIQIQPWDRGNLASIEKGIVGGGMGLNPVNDGVCVRVSIPPLTEERRADLTKMVKKLAEEAKISVRTARQETNNSFKQMESKGEITEDDLRNHEAELQKKVDVTNKTIEDLAKAKEQDIMTV